MGKQKVARLRAVAGIEAKRKMRFRVIVEHHKSDEAAPDLLNRTRRGWLHLAIPLDVYSRRVVGWAMGDKPNSTLHESALAMALEHRRPRPGLIHQTDRGTMYRTGAYRAMLRAAQLRPTMSGRKSAYYSAMAESFFSNLKNAMRHRSDFAAREQARCAVIEYIDMFYNRSRIHQSLAYLSPVQFERMSSNLLN